MVLQAIESAGWEDQLKELLGDSSDSTNPGIALAMLVLNSSLSINRLDLARRCMVVVSNAPGGESNERLKHHAQRMASAFLLGLGYDDVNGEQILSFQQILERLS
jgi:hypothetical protein